MDHTPKDETLRLKICNAFDLVGERKRTNFTGQIWQSQQRGRIKATVHPVHLNGISLRNVILLATIPHHGPAN